MNNKLALVLFGVLGAAAAWNMKPQKEQLSPPSPPPLVSVEEMGNLVSLKVNYADVIEFHNRATQGIPWTQWELRFGGSHVLLIARGECLIGTDLRLAKYEQLATATKTATLVAPHPKVISARLNHDPKTGGSRLYEASTSGLVALVPGTKGQTEAINLAFQKGQRDIETSCAQREFIEAARKNAEAVLLPAVSATGWKVAIAWR
ncbi:DUF4230 domain-containing protein [Niveibacterium sp. SC-1]|uniref:DUF4230 domain-containing protein n=1 Tax=Niveibacterium sp. SC-1 TaxID=3135646 RepID=UPI00311D8628